MNAESARFIILVSAALGGLIFAAARTILNHFAAGAAPGHAAFPHENCHLSRRIDNDLTMLAADLPRNYVKREDWIRFGAVIDARLDAMSEQVEAVKEKVYGQPQS